MVTSGFVIVQEFLGQPGAIMKRSGARGERLGLI
jgi:hypothetical protein